MKKIMKTVACIAAISAMLINYSVSAAPIASPEPTESVSPSAVETTAAPEETLDTESTGDLF